MANYLTYFRTTQEEYIQAEMTDPTFNITAEHQVVFNHTALLSEDDLDALNANHNLIMYVWLNSSVLPSGFSKSDIGNFYGNTEGTIAGATIPDLSTNGEDVTILGTYTDANRPMNGQIGLNNLFIKQDASGIPIATMPAGQIAVDATGKNVSTEWNVGGDTWTIEDINDVGHEVYTHDVSDADYYYLNGVVGTTPTAKSGTYLLDDEALDGTATTTHYAPPKVWSIVRTAQEILDDHNSWLLANEDVMTETEGGTDYLYDENGVYLYED